MAAVSALILGVAVGRRVHRVEVTGDSMTPTLQPGDRLLVLRARRIGRGDLVEVVDPRQAERHLVKRVAALDGTAVVVEGDNRAASTDSRAFGPVQAAAVRGRVFFRYSPAGRAGTLAQRRVRPRTAQERRTARR